MNKLFRLFLKVRTAYEIGKDSKASLCEVDIYSIKAGRGVATPYDHSVGTSNVERLREIDSFLRNLNPSLLERMLSRLARNL